MKKLPKPTEDAKKVFLECISNTRDDALRKKLESCAPEIAAAAIDYDSKKSNDEVHLIPSTDNVGGIITAEEMKKLYNNKLVNKKGQGRKYYDRIMVSPKNGICPICGHREVSTLDHYLSKMKYPAFAVTLINLIPSCKDCNFIKGESELSNETCATIHPYYDDVENHIWLSSQLNKNDDIVFSYEVIKPEEWDNLIFERVKNHFEVFKLNRLYSVQAAVQFEEIKRIILNMYKKNGEEFLKNYFQECIDSFECVSLNSWKSAMYRELYNNEWFYNDWLKNHANVN